MSALINIKLPERVRADLDFVQGEFGIPTKIATLEACLATIAKMTRENDLHRLVPECEELRDA